MEVLIGLISIGISVLALYKASSANRAVSEVIERKDNQEDLVRLRNVISTLNAAKETCMGRTNLSDELRRAGIRDNQALTSLSDAVDALKFTTVMERPRN